MNSEALNPMSVIPPPAAEGGSTVPASAIQPQSPIVPAFKLPDDSSKLQDRKQQRHQTPEELQEEQKEHQTETVELLNNLVGKPAFADLYFGLFNGLNVEVDQLQRLAYKDAGIGDRGTYSERIKAHSKLPKKRDHSYGSVLFYHQMMPGTRFAGNM